MKRSFTAAIIFFIITFSVTFLINLFILNIHLGLVKNLINTAVACFIGSLVFMVLPKKIEVEKKQNTSRVR